MTREATVFAAAAAAAILGGCAARGANYERPQLPTPPQYRFVDSAMQAESIADVPWWQVFNDATLQALIREAVSQNLDLRAAAARVARARAQAGIAKSFLYPQLDGTASYGARQHVSGDDSDNGVGHNGVYGFQLSWEIDVWGKIRRQHEAAFALFLATDQARRGVLVTLVGDVASDYFLLRELDLRLQIARQTLKTNDETVAYFRDRLNGGVSNRLEVDRMSANRAQTASAIPDIEQQIAVVEHALSLLLGRAPGPIVREPVGAVLIAPGLPPGLPASLLERRPDVREAEQLLVAANANVGAAKALFYPAVNIAAFGGGITGSLATALGGAGVLWSVGASALQPVYNAGRNRQNLEASRALFDEALAQYQQAALNGYREVSDALVTIQKLSDAGAERQKGVTALEDAADLARSRYDSGLASYIEILTTDEQLFEQQLLLAQTRGAELRARTELYRALGGGWQP